MANRHRIAERSWRRSLFVPLAALVLSFALVALIGLLVPRPPAALSPGHGGPTTHSRTTTPKTTTTTTTTTTAIPTTTIPTTIPPAATEMPIAIARGASVEVTTLTLAIFENGTVLQVVVDIPLKSNTLSLYAGAEVCAEVPAGLTVTTVPLATYSDAVLACTKSAGAGITFSLGKG